MALLRTCLDDHEVLDHRVREEPFGHLLHLNDRRLFVIRIDRETNELPDPNVRDVAPTQRR